VEKNSNMSNLTVSYKSPLHQMTQTTPTCLWNDSASPRELQSSIEHGAVGATCNPVIVLSVIKEDMAAWRDRIRRLAAEMSKATEDQIGWRIVEEISIAGAKLLEPAFREHRGRNGRLSIQTDPRLYRDSQAILDQAILFSKLAPNMIVKIPATRAGIPAIEEATYRGVSINATVSFSVPQAIVVAEAVERGLRRREAEGLDVSEMGPVCTIMVGRLDDWLKIYAEKHDIVMEPGYLDWAGVAAFKKAYRLYQERGYRIRLLSAAFRNHLHWSEFVGGDVVVSPPYGWQVRFNKSDIPIGQRIDVPVDSRIVDQLMAKFPDFRRAYAEDGMKPEEFDQFPPTIRTLRQFVSACSELGAVVRDVLLPNPD
jgi:transaldolase